MSQNSHTLLLFYKDKQQHKNCLLMFLKLNDGDKEKAKYFSNLLGVDVENHWDNVWFNQEVSAKPDYIRLDYDTSTSEDLPLEILRSLFKNGLDAAILDIFHDQVGEYSRHHFIDNKLVNKEALYKSIENAKKIVSLQLQTFDDEESYVTVEDEISINKLIEDEKKHNEEAKEMVSSILELGKISNETGTNPIELVKSVLILRAAGKGLLQALIFGITTVLLFKGFWLWIVLSLFAVFFLISYHISQVNKEFIDEEEVVSDVN